MIEGVVGLSVVELRIASLGFLALAIVVSGCNEGADPPASAANEPATPSVAAAAADEDAVRDREARPPRPVDPPPLRCPPEALNCETASGRILYIERVDPDGDGDAHFVLFSGEGITAPGISVVDVPADLRPHPLPRRGDLLLAAGPVLEGSFGQRQIEAIEVAVGD